MKPSQLKSLIRMTNKITKCAQFGTIEGWINGPVVFTQEEVSGSIMLVGTNCTDEKCWFETSIFVMVFIGVRGGVRITRCEGMNKFLIS